MNEITVPIDSVLVSLMVKQDQQIIAGQTLAIVEAMKMHYPINADHHGVISEIYVNEGDLPVSYTHLTLPTIYSV